MSKYTYIVFTFRFRIKFKRFGRQSTNRSTNEIAPNDLAHVEN